MRGTIIIALLIAGLVSGQVPSYTLKKFVAVDDTVEFRRTAHVENGPVKSYILTEPEIWDVDDRGTTHVRGGAHALLVVEGENRKGKREGHLHLGTDRRRTPTPSSRRLTRQLRWRS